MKLLVLGLANPCQDRLLLPGGLAAWRPFPPFLLLSGSLPAVQLQQTGCSLLLDWSGARRMASLAQQNSASPKRNLAYSVSALKCYVSMQRMFPIQIIYRHERTPDWVYVVFVTATNKELVAALNQLMEINKQIEIYASIYVSFTYSFVTCLHFS